MSSQAARKIAVKGVAAGMMTKDNIVAGWKNIKEAADDIYEDAKEEIARKADEEEQPVSVLATVSETVKS